MCHDCDSPTMNSDGICDNCVEPTTADQYNKEYYEQEKEGKTNNKGNHPSYSSNTGNAIKHNRLDEKIARASRINR